MKGGVAGSAGEVQQEQRAPARLPFLNFEEPEGAEISELLPIGETYSLELAR